MWSAAQIVKLDAASARAAVMRRISSRRHAPSCGRPGFALAVEMQRAAVRARLSQASASSPMMFSITASAWRAGSPSGQPATARICCSNWLTSAGLDGPVAGIVHARRDLVDQQRAVLRDEQLDRQHADIVQRIGDRSARWPWLRRSALASAATARWSGAGCDARAHSPADRRRRTSRPRRAPPRPRPRRRNRQSLPECRARP